MMKLRHLRHLDKDEILSALGLQSRTTAGQWLAGTLGVFGIGLLCGAGLALLVTPKTGPELRRVITHRIRRAGSPEPGDGHTLESGV